MIDLRDWAYVLLCVSFSLVLGAGVYEHLAVWPYAYAAPPASLSMFQGAYGLNGGAFWAKIHPVTLLLFVVVAVLTWRTPRRLHVLVPLLGYIVILAVTSTYFVPELLAINATPYRDAVDPELLARSLRWERLSLVRLFVAVPLVLYLVVGLAKAGRPVREAALA